MPTQFVLYVVRTIRITALHERKDILDVDQFGHRLTDFPSRQGR